MREKEQGFKGLNEVIYNIFQQTHYSLVFVFAWTHVWNGFLSLCDYGIKGSLKYRCAVLCPKMMFSRTMIQPGCSACSATGSDCQAVSSLGPLYFLCQVNVKHFLLLYPLITYRSISCPIVPSYCATLSLHTHTHYVAELETKPRHSLYMPICVVEVSLQ